MSDQGAIDIGFVGGGNMAQAIIRGLLRAGHTASRLSVMDPSTEQREAIKEIDPAINLTEDSGLLANRCAILVLAVKPQIIADVAMELSKQQRPAQQIIVSVAAGVTLESLRNWFGESTPIVRVMPNQPALAGEGMSGLCATPAVDAAGRAAADYLLAATGKAAWFDDEQLMDAVTAISGSGPAYYYLIMEIMQDVAREFGFTADAARMLSTQTALGAATVATQGSDELAHLRQQVTSPGGTTAAALSTLEEAGIRDIFRNALIAARDRSVELGKQHKTG
jgi:pyrroline-5-carboxylate reductase